MADIETTSQDPMTQATPETQMTGDAEVGISDIIMGVEESSSLGEFESSLEPSQTDSPENVVEPQQAETQQPAPAELTNDEVRYNYWQSEADKRKNELDNAMKTNDILTKQLNTLMSNSAAQNNQQAQPQEQKAEEFPPPPEKPQRPSYFNREEAYSDPQSESARYLDQVETWRDDMDEYNRLEREYNTALVQTEREEMQAQRRREDAARQQARQEQEQRSKMKSYIQTRYNVDDATFANFERKMSDPKSINPDNLWRLYQMDEGIAPAPAANPGPSPAFKQTRNAQSIPSSMGVLPSQNVTTDSRSAEDKLMDAIISENDKYNVL
jgi:hypothetical protein